MSLLASMPGVGLHSLLQQLPFDYSIDACDPASVQVTADDSAALDNIKVCGLCADSRELATGDIFAALQGGSYHGLDYLELVNRKAAALLVDIGDARAASIETPLPVVRVSSLSDRLGEIAATVYQHPTAKMKVCGVTGTDGKTSVSRFIALVLQELGLRAGYIGTIGWGLADGTVDRTVDNDDLVAELEDNPLTTPPPATLQAMLASLQQRKAEYVVLEVSSHALAQGRTSGVQFDVVALTNLGRDHLDYHHTLENYRAAKRMLFDWPGIDKAVLNLDDEFGREIAGDFAANETSAAKVAGYSINTSSETQPASELFATDVVADTRGVAFTLHHKAQQWRVETGLLGHFNVSNLLAASAVLMNFGIDLPRIIKALSRLKPVDGRMERFHAAGRPTAVVDYSHTPQSLGLALETVRQHCDGALWVVFGCGGDRDRGKRPQMGRQAVELADHVVVTDDNPRTESSAEIIDEILAGTDSADRSGSSSCLDLTVIADRREAIVYAMTNAAAADWVLVAGKGHEDYQIVGTDQLHFSDRAVVTELLSAAAPDSALSRSGQNVIREAT